ncbi:GntR family transcriptional regulator [Janibacter limosus]|uniref:GntR family transcriptional regulator n=1 Tax=Janibacter limosus TaxID=53458 RepID=UPI00083352DD|nr:GntR family transcriptional regulator [Janibacter limosus]
MHTLPRWRQISDDLMRRVQGGEFVDGFPGELSLTTEYGVSRGTIRRALEPLRERGVVGGARGRQSYVINASRTSGLGPMYSLREAITANGTSERSEVLAQRVVTSEVVARALGLEADTPFVHITRVRFVDDDPIAFDRLWIIASVAAPLLDADLTETSVYESLRSRCGVEFDAGVEHTRSVGATGEVASRLGVPEGTALLTIRRKSCLNGRPAELRDTCAVGERVTLTHVFGDASAVLNCGGNGRPVEIPWE